MDEDEGVQENNKEKEEDGLDGVDWRKRDSSGQGLILVTLTFSQSDPCTFLLKCSFAVYIHWCDNPSESVS